LSFIQKEKRLHYIYVNSQDKKAEEAICDFTINLHNPITSVKRVGISSFTSSNNSYNVNENNNNVRWLEEQADYIGLPTRTMEVIIPPAYYSINELLTLIVRLMTEAIEAIDKNGATILRKYNSETKIIYIYIYYYNVYIIIIFHFISSYYCVLFYLSLIKYFYHIKN
jgi:hypothetical protein